MGSASRPGRSLPQGKTQYPLYRRLGGPQGRSGQVLKISPPLGFDPRTVLPVTSRYTNYATRPTFKSVLKLKYFNPLNAELNPICYLLALLGAHNFLHVSRIRVKSLTLRLLMSHIYIYIYIYIYMYMEHLFLMFLDHTQRRSTVGRTPLDE